MRKRVIYIFFVITLQHPDAEGSTGFNGPFTRQHTFIPINQVKSRFISAASSLVSEFGSKHIIQHCIKESYTLTATNLVTSFILNRKLKTTKKGVSVVRNQRFTHSVRVREAPVLFQLRKHKAQVHAEVTDVVFCTQLLHYPPSLS